MNRKTSISINPKSGQSVERDGPRKHEDRFDLEDHEQHRDEVVANAVSIPRVGHRLDAALVRFEFDGVGLFGWSRRAKTSVKIANPVAISTNNKIGI